MFLNRLLPNPSPAATPQNSPLAPRQPTPQLLVSRVEQDGIPEVVLIPPEDDDPPTPPLAQEEGPVGVAMPWLLPPEGKYAHCLPVTPV